MEINLRHKIEDDRKPTLKILSCGMQVFTNEVTG